MGFQVARCAFGSHGGRTEEPERKPGEQIHAVNRYSLAQTHIYTQRLTSLPPHLELTVCYWSGYDVLTDEADVISLLGDSLLKGSGIS